MEATTGTEARLQVTETRRAPIRSITGPASTFISTSGSVSASATRPVSTALPVESSTSSGSATMLTRVPVRVTSSAVSQP